MTNGQDPFQVVLIDIQKAANHEIHCVKKPLTEELKYVAISYRWGELEEFMIDTHVGYSASITSFNISDFYKLCEAMIKEPTMASIPYVWVDTICVNQSNHDARKATIYHMSEIYEHATWILAVPDLHAAHLKAMHSDVMGSIQEHQAYLYHLLHDHSSILHEMDHDFFDQLGVPKVPNLRLSLTTNRDNFKTKLWDDSKLSSILKNTHTIESLYNNNNKSGIADLVSRGLQTSPTGRTPHQCDNVDWLIEYFQKSGDWNNFILIRSTGIKHAMQFLTALVVDWSSRVWVISEFHIAKKKNNLKFWFNQLNGDNITFFTFDMDDPRFTSIQNPKLPEKPYASDPAYITFYQQLFNQLNRQSLLEMMLKSKASKNEDRFYAIFPFVPQYKHLLHNKELVTNMNTLLDVKLKLYQVMTNQDKVLLLYLSYKGTETLALPTFATRGVDWTDPHKHVNLIHSMHVTLLYKETVGHYLRVKPTKYVLTLDIRCFEPDIIATLNRLLYPKALRKDGYRTFVDVVLLFVTMHTPIMLIGHHYENIWILAEATLDAKTEPIQNYPGHYPGFHVY